MYALVHAYVCIKKSNDKFGVITQLQTIRSFMWLCVLKMFRIKSIYKYIYIYIMDLTDSMKYSVFVLFVAVRLKMLCLQNGKLSYNDCDMLRNYRI